MNENAPTNSEDLRPATRRPHRSIEDNYPEYLEHEYGYAYEVADVMSQTAIVRHEELLHADTDELEAVALDSLDDFQKWAVARAWRRLGNTERFFGACETLLDSKEEHPVVIYSEISRWLAEELARAERLEEAHERLASHLERWPSDVQAQELIGIIDLLANEGDDTRLRELVAEYPADAELRFEIAEDLWRFEKLDAARAWLDEAREAATSTGDQAALVDIELLAARITDEE
jgi:hypothetical protein